MSKHRSPRAIPAAMNAARCECRELFDHAYCPRHAPTLYATFDRRHALEEVLA